ncbi:MAG TPA: hypothetical protein VGI10_05405 [Polyangiaceae bacterium]|jgi:hypothetical protein
MKKRQWLGALVALAIVSGFVAALALHLFTIAVCILLGAVTVAYVLSIAWMRTRPSRRDRHPSRAH